MTVEIETVRAACSSVEPQRCAVVLCVTAEFTHGQSNQLLSSPLNGLEQHIVHLIMTAEQAH